MTCLPPRDLRNEPCQQLWPCVHCSGPSGAGLHVVTPFVVQHLLGTLQMHLYVQVLNAACVGANSVAVPNAMTPRMPNTVKALRIGIPP